MKEQGWIKLHRKSINSSIWQNQNAWRVWCWCLMKANHQDINFPFNCKDIEVKKGQFITGREKACLDTYLTPQKYRTALKYLKLTNRITIKSNNKFSTITVLKWEEYQEDNQQLNQPITNQQPTNNQPITTNKNDKNDKNTISKDIETSNETFGNEDINWLIGEFESIMKFKSAGTKDRFMAKHLLKNFTHEQLTAMLTYCSTNEYAPRIGSVEKMWYKRGDIIAGIKSTTNKSNMTII